MFFLYGFVLVNPPRACAARVTVVVLCVCVCVCVCVRSFMPPRACRSQNICANEFTAMQKKTFIIVVFAKMLRSEAKASFFY